MGWKGLETAVGALGTQDGQCTAAVFVHNPLTTHQRMALGVVILNRAVEGITVPFRVQPGQASLFANMYRLSSDHAQHMEA